MAIPSPDTGTIIIAAQAFVDIRFSAIYESIGRATKLDWQYAHRAAASAGAVVVDRLTNKTHRNNLEETALDLSKGMLQNVEKSQLGALLIKNLVDEPVYTFGESLLVQMQDAELVVPEPDPELVMMIRPGGVA